eukprot:TRINITY_DN19674_c0_g1_i2.p1 TRINITY_DN19674_c0_g1~~TRINITY_DN19674_c0_g1_i2.p1  ORF type:complete len:237 (+),score=54.92 TRINITY_DN19674_c0_g1_i2:107-817(+)
MCIRDRVSTQSTGVLDRNAMLSRSNTAELNQSDTRSLGHGHTVPACGRMDETSVQFVEWRDAFSRKETEHVRVSFDEIVAPSMESFTGVAALPETEWVYQRMVDLAVRADAEAGWGLLRSPQAAHTDELVYDRFGPEYSDVDFSWHVDAGESDPRLVSVVAYLSDAEEFEGGGFEMELVQPDGSVSVERREFVRGCAIAFPSKRLKHVVLPITRGERRSFLLLVGNRSSFNGWTVV